MTRAVPGWHGTYTSHGPPIVRLCLPGNQRLAVYLGSCWASRLPDLAAANASWCRRTELASSAFLNDRVANTPPRCTDRRPSPPAPLSSLSWRSGAFLRRQKATVPCQCSVLWLEPSVPYYGLNEATRSVVSHSLGSSGEGRQAPRSRTRDAGVDRGTAPNLPACRRLDVARDELALCQRRRAPRRAGGASHYPFTGCRPSCARTSLIICRTRSRYGRYCTPNSDTNRVLSIR